MAKPALPSFRPLPHRYFHLPSGQPVPFTGRRLSRTTRHQPMINSAQGKHSLPGRSCLYIRWVWTRQSRRIPPDRQRDRRPHRKQGRILTPRIPQHLVSGKLLSTSQQTMDRSSRGTGQRTGRIRSSAIPDPSYRGYRGRRRLPVMSRLLQRRALMPVIRQPLRCRNPVRLLPQGAVARCGCSPPLHG